VIILFSRNDCPLCEEVEDMLVQFEISYRYVDIDLDDNLRKKYHVLVPVLQNLTKQELRFPFDEGELKRFVL